VTAATTLHFGPYALDPAAVQLHCNGRAVALRPKAYAVLLALLRRPGEMVSKEDLLDSVWGRRFITEGVIKSVVAELRTALGDDAKQARWIATVPGRGYRFIGEVQRAGADRTRAWPSRQPPARSAATCPPRGRT
jgi:DNA-binding winged helix-turn-helix (wHTH) protein